MPTERPLTPTLLFLFPYDEFRCISQKGIYSFLVAIHDRVLWLHDAVSSTSPLVFPFTINHDHSVTFLTDPARSDNYNMFSPVDAVLSTA